MKVLVTGAHGKVGRALVPASGCGEGAVSASVPGCGYAPGSGASVDGG